MRRLLKTRHGFFLSAAIVCSSLTVVIEPAFRWVTLAAGGLYLVLAVLFLLHDLGQTPLTGSPEMEPSHGQAPGTAATAPIPPPPPIRDPRD